MGRQDELLSGQERQRFLSTGFTFSSLEHAVHAVWGRCQLGKGRVPAVQDRGAVECKDEKNQGQKTLQVENPSSD